ncbi:MAG: ribosome assembly factor SBDS [Candidatus Diapherotrites archaeon]
MVRVEDAVIARFEHSGEKFEILVDPNLAMDLKHGKAVDFDELLAIDSVFKDAHKGEVKSEESLKKVFGTTNVVEIAKKIILSGEVQLTTQQRREMIERKKNDVVAFIVKNCMNPQTKAPHPPQRIKLALEEIKFNFDINKSTPELVQEALKGLKKVLPISMDKLKVAVKIPASYAAKSIGILKKYEVKKEEWQNDGSLVALLELPAGIKQDLFNELNHLTHGDFDSKVLDV